MPFVNYKSLLIIRVINLCSFCNNSLFKYAKVGTGFSFTDKDAGYARNETDVARDLLKCVAGIR